jgi:hypothetical protein
MGQNKSRTMTIDTSVRIIDCNTIILPAWESKWGGIDENMAQAPKDTIEACDLIKAAWKNMRRTPRLAA